jgi:glycosyltransferase involved in cell wall biosynthesis
VASVLFLVKGLGRGGMEQLLAASAPYLDRSRFRYESAYLLPWKDAVVPGLEAVGVRTWCLGRDATWVLRLRDLVRRRAVDLVHAHSPYPAAAARLALGRNVRMVYTEHNVWARYRAATRWANMVTFARNDHVFAVSDEVRASIRYPPPLRVRRMPVVETLYHGLDPAAPSDGGSADGVREELGIPAGSPLIGTVGSLTPKKDHYTLLRAAARASRSVPDLRVVVIGQGPLEADLRRAARRLRIEDLVVFTGYREDARRVMGALDVFALSSRHEGLPVSLLEAMSMGRPVVATTAGGTGEVVTDGQDGLLVPIGDPAALGDALARLAGDPELRRRLGEAARRRSKDFDIRKAVRRQEEVYGELLE